MQVRYGLLVAAGIIIIAVLWFVMFNPLVAKTGDTVVVYYTGTLDDGTVSDTNLNASPLEFTLEKGTVILGFEEAVAGMAVNDVKTTGFNGKSLWNIQQLSCSCPESVSTSGKHDPG